jgi:outer membrane protein
MMMTMKHAVWIMCAGLLVAASGAAAADLQVPVAEATQVEAAQSPWQVRVRALGVIPNDGGSVDGIDGSDLDYSSSVTPELDITYYFTNNIAAELILGTTSSHVYTDGSIEGLGEVGKAWILPPTLTLQYHFTNFGAFKPYVGAGVNYTIFYKQTDAGDFDDMDIDNSFGAALQFGFDYMLDQHWGLNFDVKKIFLEPDWTANLNGNQLSGEADVSPWLIGGGVTYRF